MQNIIPVIRNRKWLSVLAVVTAMLIGGCAIKPEAKMAKHMAKGQECFKTQDYRRAIIEFKNAAAAKPKEPEPHYQMALAYFEAGDGASALAELRRTTALNPNHSGANAKLATLMVSTRNPELIQQGERLARQALTADPTGMEPLSALALAEMKTGKSEDAAKHLELALAKFPKNMKAAANLASVKVGRRDFAGAEEVLKKAAAEMPKSSKPFIALGRFYLLVDRTDDSEAQFRKALSLDPKDAVAMRDLAELLSLRGRTGDAEEIYKQLSALPFKASKPLYAMFLYRTGKRDQAVALFVKLLAEDPNNRDLRNYLVGAYLSMGQMEPAKKVITAALQRNPKDNDALLQRSQLYLGTGEFTSGPLQFLQRGNHAIQLFFSACKS
jgi:Flp pilus assembly protein TadD